MKDDDKPWDPANELDPEKVQKEYLEVAKDLLGQLKADNNKKKAEEEAYTAVPPGAIIAPYRSPTFSELSAKLKLCWEETKKIAPDAPEFVQAEIIRTLLHAHMDDPSV